LDVTLAPTLLTLGFGGLTGALLASVLTQRRERRTTTDERAASQWLVAMELANAHVGAQRILEGEWYTRFPTDAWEQERSKLARGLPREAFLVLSGTYNVIHGYNWRFEAQVFQNDDPDNSLLFRCCERMRESAFVALKTLEEVRM
jgi:hypothetical protein